MDQNKQAMNNESQYQFARTRVWPKFLAIGVIFVAVAIAVWKLPRGYSTDLALIGKGKPALVQVFDPNQKTSLELMETINGLRGDYEGRIEFLIADQNIEPGRTFSMQQGAQAPAMLLFAANGAKLAVTGAPQTQDELKKQLEQVLVK